MQKISFYYHLCKDTLNNRQFKIKTDFSWNWICRPSIFRKCYICASCEKKIAIIWQNILIIIPLHERYDIIFHYCNISINKN